VLAAAIENLKKLVYFAINLGGNKVTTKGKETLIKMARKANLANTFIMGVKA